MTIDRKRFEWVLLELIDENPIACQGVLSILDVVFTEEVPTLAVSLSDPPRLYVNVRFVERETWTELEVKSLLLHEFLHVLLNHTQGFGQSDAAANLAFDAVVNHLIHRLIGEDYSAFMRRYYHNARGMARLLRPEPDPPFGVDPISRIGQGLLDGRIVVDDILSLSERLREQGEPGDQPTQGLPVGTVLLGNHGSVKDEEGVAEEAREALSETLRSYDGHGMLRNPTAQGFGAQPYPEKWSAGLEDLSRWRESTYRVLRSLCQPDPQSTLREEITQTIHMPVLNESDRRAFLRTLWNPVLPEVAWQVRQTRPGGSAVIYLDVSGSMYDEMQSIVTLLWSLSSCIRMPFYAFSDEVATARIRDGVLEAETTGGTSMNCVLAHFGESDMEKAVVVTDGYIERCDPKLLERIAPNSLHAVVSRDGSTDLLDAAGIPCHQLGGMPALQQEASFR